MKFKRSSGVLLHPTSLPGEFGIGTLGKEACKFVDFLKVSGQKLWQILPLGHTGYGDSPYQCFSSIAGNPLLIDIEFLYQNGLLTLNDIAINVKFPDDHVDYQKVFNHKLPLLRKAYNNFINLNISEKRKYHTFCEENADWLDDYSLFMSLKSTHDMVSWTDWEPQYILREKKSLELFKEKYQIEIEFNKFIQFLFFDQWLKLKEYANDNGIKIIGDIPIYVSADSVEAWTNSEIFLFDVNKKPSKVAGVPPDYFSETGQLWGNPIYNWQVLEESDFFWWKKRIMANLNLYDIFRIDHFRGFSEFYAIPYGEETAIKGEWLPCPGRKLFKSLLNEFGDLPIIAEDLGVITDEVNQLRDEFGFPGMKRLQFAFDSNEKNDYLPHTYDKNCVVYTGTHDNDTVKGWYLTASPENQKEVADYIILQEEDISWSFIRLAHSSVADFSIIPLQDILSKDSNARMNIPGTTMGNWKWRFEREELNSEIAIKLAHITKIFGR